MEEFRELEASHEKPQATGAALLRDKANQVDAPGTAVNGNESVPPLGRSQRPETENDAHSSTKTTKSHRHGSSWIKRNWRQTQSVAKFIALMTAGIIAYYQYLDQSIETNIGREETLFSSTATQLGSESEAVRASALSTLYELSFTRTPIETPPGPLAPIINVTKWIVYSPGYRNYNRCTLLFSEFAAAPRRPVQTDRDMVSSQILEIAVKWMDKQHKLLGIDRRSPNNWLLVRAQVSKASAPSLDLREVQFSKADFSSSDLSYSDFTDSNLQGSHLTESILRGAQFSGADLSNTLLTGAKLDFSHLNSARLQDADLRHASMNMVTAEGANFDGAKLSGASLKNADLKGATFRGADLSGVDASGADLTGANFERAVLFRADFRYASGLINVQSWRGAKLTRVMFPPQFQPSSR